MVLINKERVNLIKGRDNLALTIMVPYDCENNCKFCISKQEYALHKPDKEKVIRSLYRFFALEGGCGAHDVVITGGEPMSDINFLREVVNQVPKVKDIYINTSFIKKNIDEFINFVNSTSQIKGVNISRHTVSYEDDCKILCNIAEDEWIREIKKSIRINCVIGESTSLIDGVVDRWKAFKNVEISFRADFTRMTEKDLHVPFCKVNNYLASKFSYVGNTQCHVCDTTAFKTDEGMLVKYHRGLKTTSIRTPKGIEVNDFVLRQDGKLFLDWDFKKGNEVTIGSDLPFERYTGYSYSSTLSCGGACGHTSRYVYSGCGYRGC